MKFVSKTPISFWILRRKNPRFLFEETPTTHSTQGHGIPKVPTFESYQEQPMGNPKTRIIIYDCLVFSRLKMKVMRGSMYLSRFFLIVQLQQQHTHSPTFLFNHSPQTYSKNKKTQREVDLCRWPTRRVHSRVLRKKIHPECVDLNRVCVDSLHSVWVDLQSYPLDAFLPEQLRLFSSFHESTCRACHSTRTDPRYQIFVICWS